MKSLFSQRSDLLRTLFLVVLGIVVLSSPSEAEIVFKDDFSRPGYLPEELSISIDQGNPQIGAAYTGIGRVFDPKRASGTAAQAGVALGGTNFAQAPAESLNGTRWNLGEAGMGLTLDRSVLISFDFYLAGGDGKQSMNIISFQDKNTGGRGIDLLLKDDGTVSWHDGRNHLVSGTFPVNAAVRFEMLIEFASGYFMAKIGDLKFSGNLVADSHDDFYYDPHSYDHVAVNSFASLMFYSSNACEFFYNNAQIRVLPIELAQALLTGGK